MNAIEQLYEQHKQDVYRYLLSLTRNPVLSEDLLSETFISAIRSISRFRGESSIKTWLFTIARHKWLDHLRGNKSNASYNELFEQYADISVEANFLGTELEERIDQLLTEKDERARQIVKMRIEGFSYNEIANTLQMSESGARVVDFRTKQWLRVRLQEEGLI